MMIRISGLIDDIEHTFHASYTILQIEPHGPQATGRVRNLKEKSIQDRVVTGRHSTVNDGVGNIKKNVIHKANHDRCL